ncbi:TlpA family protein disulfide reductase [Myxococcota bacterium]
MISALLLATVTVAHPKNVEQLVGKPAPHFELPRLTKGAVSLTDLKGNPVILVIGSTRESAPASREWMVQLERNFRRTDTKVFQVVVLDNPWFLPEFAVKNMLRDFIPKHGYDLVLIEWSTAFGVAYGIPKDDITRVLILDREGVVCWLHVGERTDQAMVTLLTQVDKL